MKELKDLKRTKIRNITLVFFLGCLLYALSFLDSSENILSKDMTIYRNSYNEGDKDVKINVKNQRYGIDKEVEFRVNEKKYSDEEIEKFADKLDCEIEKIILKDNETVDFVNSDLYFPDRIDGYPFKLKYSVSKALLIDGKGQIDFERLKKEDPENQGVLIKIDISYEYYEFLKVYSFYLNLFYKDLSFEDKFDEALNEKLSIYDEKYNTKDYMVLPREVGGIKLTYYEKNKKSGLFIILFTFFLMIFSGIMTDREFKKEIEKRNTEMLADYPRIINKFTLYYDAGMPVKSIWKRICDEYRSDKARNGKSRAIYELMILSETEMKEGKSEIESYENFAKRCGLSKYRNFVSLIEQIIVKGKKDVSEILKNESLQAFNERKINGKRLLEEASTKLLLPMFMMLLIVMIMIVYPAFVSFK